MTKPDPLKLSPEPPSRSGRWRGRAEWLVEREANRGTGRLRWGRVIGVLLGLTLAGYGGTVAAAYSFVRFYRGLETVRFADLALPWRWDRYRVARGEHHLASAQRLGAEGKHREALLYARAGLAQVPDHRAGRLLLVNLLGGAGRPESAGDTLLEGLRYHLRDAAYLKRVLVWLLQQQDDARVVALARERLPGLHPTEEPARMLALAAATASYYRGGYDQAEDFMQRLPRLAESRDGRLLAVKIERDRGYRELSLLQLRSLAADFPRDEEVHRELAGQLRAHGLNDEARRLSLAFQIAHPDLAGPRLELLQAYAGDADRVRVGREVEAILRDFAADGAALLRLAEWGANTGEVALVRRIGAPAAALGLPAEPLALLAVEAAVVARDYRGALEAIRGLLAEEGGRGRSHQALFDSLQAIAHLGLGDRASARLFLNSFLGQVNLRVDNLLAVANRLATLEGSQYAWQVLARAVEIDPRNQAALARLIELDLALNRIDALPPHVRQFVGMRRPSPDILRVVQQRLGSDLFLFSADAPAALGAVREALEAVERRPRR